MATAQATSDPNLANKKDGAAAACDSCDKDQPSGKLSNTQQFAKDYLKRIDQPFNCGPNVSEENCLLVKWLQWKHQDYTKKCQGFFINEDGRMGPFSSISSKLMFNDVLKNGDKSLFMQGNSDFEEFCPGFNSFTTDQKIQFHTWIFELTAFPENVCSNKNSVVQGVNTAAACMFQLNYPVSARSFYSKPIGETHCMVSPQELLTDKGCIGCAFDVYKGKMHREVKNGREPTPFGVFNKAGKKISGSYWASQNKLLPAQEKCFEQYLNPAGKPIIGPDKRKPLFLTKCKSLGANFEWTPRYKFFKRIQRFPLCETKFAKLERDNLARYLAQKGQK